MLIVIPVLTVTVNDESPSLMLDLIQYMGIQATLNPDMYKVCDLTHLIICIRS